MIKFYKSISDYSDKKGMCRQTAKKRFDLGEIDLIKIPKDAKLIDLDDIRDSIREESLDSFHFGVIDMIRYFTNKYFEGQEFSILGFASKSGYTNISVGDHVFELIDIQVAIENNISDKELIEYIDYCEDNSEEEDNYKTLYQYINREEIEKEMKIANKRRQKILAMTPDELNSFLKKSLEDTKTS